MRIVKALTAFIATMVMSPVFPFMAAYNTYKEDMWVWEEWPLEEDEE